MVKVKKSNYGDRQQTTQRISGLFRFFLWGKSNQVEHKQTKNNAQKDFISNKFSNDIFISSSGLAKIDKLDSCLNLVSSDFIIF